MVHEEVMIDIETLSTRPNAVILTIGAIKFDRKGPLKKLEEMDQFYVRISKESCELSGMIIDEGTVQWWSRQDKEIQYEALENPVDRLEIKDALVKLKEWIGHSTLIWGNGSDFDCTILTEAYKLCNLKPPWSFWNTRDVRTAFDFGKVHVWDLPDNFKHHPVHDCYRQIIGLKRSLENLKLE